jgi:hypothetical protein
MSGSLTSRWTTPSNVKTRLCRRWERGDILANSLEDRALFPLRIPIQGPTSGEISADFSAVRDWIADWQVQSRIPCEWKEFTHRLFGTNKMPAAALFPDAESIVRLLGVQREWETFHNIAEETRTAFPELGGWLSRRPMLSLELAPDWKRLLAVVAWVRDHPRSGRFIRQIDVPGVHTKFVERYRGTLAELLDLVLPQEAIDTEARGAVGFNRRYGFHDKPERIRLRFLDPACAVEPGRLGLDLTLTADAFAALAPPVERVFITENEINFIAFPDHPGSLVIFGAGYGWSALKNAAWLLRCEVHYWGDIDTHGFAILDQLRGYIPHAQSLLMDRETFNALRDYWTIEQEPLNRELHRLSSEERNVFNLLCNEAGHGTPRLEQELLPFPMVQKALRNLNQTISNVHRVTVDVQGSRR